MTTLLTVKTTDHFDTWADIYDLKARENKWKSPKVLFELQRKFLHPDDKILDLGCGTGLTSELYHKIQMDVWGLDGSKKMIEICRKKNLHKDLKIFDLSQENLCLPYQNNFFEQAISSGAMYFIADIEPIIKEVARILWAGGTFVFDIQEPEKNKQDYLIDSNNKLIGKVTKEKTGVNVYFNDFIDVKKLLQKYRFYIVEKEEFHGFTSQAFDEVHLTAIVAKLG